MYNYKGKWVGGGGSHGSQSLTLDNTLWASTVICNELCYALVLHIGSETRIRMNIKGGDSKVGKTDCELNLISKYLFAIMVGISVVLHFASGVGRNIVVDVIKYLLLLSSIIPISLRINLDFSKVVFSHKINSDKDINA